MNIKKFIFNKMTIMALILASLYQVFMLGIYLSGYKYSASHTDKATVVYVNNDGKTGATLIDSLASKLDYQEKHVATVKKAKTLVQDHQAMLVVNVPKGYTQALTSGKTAHFNFYMSSAGDQTSSGTAKALSSALTQNVNEAVTSKKMQATMLAVMQEAAKPQVQAAVNKAQAADPTLASNPEKLAATTTAIQTKIDATLTTKVKTLTNLNNVQSSIIDLNKKETPMNKSMAPMMTALAGFVAAMTASSIIFGGFTKVVKRNRKDKWKAFASLEIVFLGISVAAAIVSTLTLMIVNGISGEIIAQMFGATTLNIFVSFQLLSVTNLIFGQLSIFVNLPMTLFQAIASGSIMSAPVMSPVYRFLRNLVPVPSTWQLNEVILFDAKPTASPLLHLIIIGVVALAISLLLIFIRFRRDSSNNTIDTGEQMAEVEAASSAIF
jgi:hypothetical protein